MSSRVTRTRRDCLRGGLALAGLGLLSGCGLRPLRWPSTSRRIPVIGFVKQAPILNHLEAFRGTMRELGYVEGASYTLHSRIADQPSQIAGLAQELARLPVDLLVCPNGAALEGVRQAAGAMTIVSVTEPDPLSGGVVESLAGPGEATVGPELLPPGLTDKRLQILRELSTGISNLGVFWNPDDEVSAAQWAEARESAATLRLQALSLEVRSPTDFEGAFARAVSGGADALFVPVTRMPMAPWPSIAKLAIEHRLPSMAFLRDYPASGGLASFGASVPAVYRRAAFLVDKLLQGADPATLPVERTTQSDMILNISTARSIGLTIPGAITMQAAEMIR